MTVKRVAFVGPSGAGKDTAGIWLGRYSRLKYKGSLSWLICPHVARELGQDTRYAYARRHEYHKDWQRITDAYRRADPLRLVRLALEQADILTGNRSLIEVQAVKDNRLVDLIVWVDNPRVPPDPTLEFGPEIADKVVTNDQDLDTYYSRLRALFSGLI